MSMAGIGTVLLTPVESCGAEGAALVGGVGKGGVSSGPRLDIELWEFSFFKLGLADLLRLVADEDRDIGSLNRDLRASVVTAFPESCGSGKRKRPVLGSASGAAETIFSNGRFTEPT